MSRQQRLLALLLVVLCGALIYAWYRTPRQKSVTTASPATSAKPVTTTATVPSAVQSGHQSLQLPEPEQVAVVVKRNLFSSASPAAAKKPAYTPAVAVKPSPTPPPLPPPPPTAHELASNELKQYKSLGLLKKQGRLVAFLAKGHQIRLVRIGDQLISGYTVTSLSDERILLRSQDGDEVALGLR